MGTEIALSVGGMDVSWSKNSMGIDHGHLFQSDDQKRFHSDQINYDHFKDRDDSELAEMEMGFVKPLGDVLPRLELLGFSLSQVKRDFERATEDSNEMKQMLSDLETPVSGDSVEFETFLAFISEFAINELDDTAHFDRDEEANAVIRGRFGNRDIVEKLPHFNSYEDHAYSERSYFGGLLDFLHPYSILRVLAENSNNLEIPVTWQYGPLVTGGYVTEEIFVPSARRQETFLIATEGSSDAHILRHAIELLRPEMSDFFRFIDMSERHPFPGTGNLHKFAEGLSKIDVHNQLVLVYDNDAEGRATFQRTQGLSLPKNMRVAMLPNLPAFEKFPTVGPDGMRDMDINGRAAAIECYLDLSSTKTPEPKVRWSSYIKDVEAYQGSLENKTQFMKSFMKLRADKLADSDYDFSKIKCVLDMLYCECVSIADSA